MLDKHEYDQPTLSQVLGYRWEKYPVYPKCLKLTDSERAKLDKIQEEAITRHKKAQKAAEKRGRSYPVAPYESSWAYEGEFRGEVRKHLYTHPDYCVYCRLHNNQGGN